jgi:PAS domain S-box-containing protein
MSAAAINPAATDIVALTAETLANRPSRARDLETENRALLALADELAVRPDTVLTTLCKTVVDCSKAGSAGISLLTSDDVGGPIFYWPAIAGAWAPYTGGTMPRDASPCGVVVNLRASLLFPGSHEFFAPFIGIEQPIIEVLLAPFFVDGEAVGTVWAICHSVDELFEREDQRFLQSVSRFAAAAYQVIKGGEARRRAQDRLNLTLSNAEIIGLWDWEIPTDRVVADERFATLFGVDPARAATGASVAEFVAGIHPDDRPRVYAEIAAAVKTAAPFSSEYRLRSQTGDVRHVMARGRCEYSSDGKPLRFPGVVVDVTKQRRAERALFASEHQFHHLAQAMPNHVWTASASGQLDWVNDQVINYSGLPLSSLIGDQWTAIVHPDDLPAALAQWREALSTGEPYETEFRLRRADGTYRWHLARAMPLEWTRDEGSRWVGTNTDIEDQKSMAAALADLNAELEDRIAARTDELRIAEESVRQLQKMEAVGHLTGGIAHDFNNMLTGITGSLELIGIRLNSGRTEGLDRFITSALSSAHRAAALTHRLLAFARRQSLDSQPHDITRLIAGMRDLLHRTLGEMVQLEMRAAPNLWLAMIDANQFENALLNLVINARDAMPNGGSLTIETSNKTLTARGAGAMGLEPGDYVKIAVRDTGIGMTEDVAARAFDPFYTTKPVGIGTGLGLSMVYGFAKQSGGHVLIRSEHGIGTTIKLYLPRALSPAAPKEITLTTEIAEGGRERVLVVEDDPAVRQLIGEVLDELGYERLLAPEAADAMPFLHSDLPIDLLITDVGLPRIDGRKFAEIARHRRPGLKVLFITGYAENATDRNAFLAPGMEMMTKPFALSALAAKIRELVGVNAAT